MGTGSRGRGYLPDTHDIRSDPSVRALLGAPARLPAAVLWESLTSPVHDQGPTASCVGWAFADAIALRDAIARQHMPSPPLVPPFPSAQGIYTAARAFGRSTPDTPLSDTGCQPMQAVQAMELWGVASDLVWPFDPATIDEDPKLDQLEDDTAHVLTGYYRIGSDGPQRILDIKHALSEGYPVAFGTQVDQAFEDHHGSGVLLPPDAAHLLGGHMMHVIGYREDGAFRGKNQWGTSWGDSGLYWCSPDYLTSPYAGDFYVLTAQPKGL